MSKTGGGGSTERRAASRETNHAATAQATPKTGARRRGPPRHANGPPRPQQFRVPRYPGRLPVTPEYSIVIPVLNECETLEALYQRITPVMDALDGSCEVILVDDGSTDGSAEIMRGLHERDDRFTVVRLSRNFGHQIAISAGLDHAARQRGDRDGCRPPRPARGRAGAREEVARGFRRRLRGARRPRR